MCTGIDAKNGIGPTCWVRLPGCLVQKYITDCVKHTDVQQRRTIFMSVIKQNKDVNKENEIYTKDEQRCKQRQRNIYKG